MRRSSSGGLSLRDHADQLIRQELGGCQSAPSRCTVHDLTDVVDARVVEICQKLVDSEVFVLHGSNTLQVLAQLDPRQANDAAKASGNQIAVYATLDVDVALANAILNRRYIHAALPSFVFGHGFSNGKKRFRATENLYQLFSGRDRQLYADGHVYVLDRRRFLKADDTATEYHSFDSQVPVAVFHVSKRLAESLFILGSGARDDTVVRYAPEEIGGISAHMRQMEGQSNL